MTLEEDSVRALRSISASSVCGSLLKDRLKSVRTHRLPAAAVQRSYEQQRRLWLQVHEDLKDDGVKCDVCSNSDTTADDPIVLCDGCDTAVHQSCYAIEQVPENEWFCEFCQSQRDTEARMQMLTDIQRRRDFNQQQRQAEASSVLEAAEAAKLDMPSLPRRCVLCPRTTGALIRTTEGLWAHVSCGLWVPECWVIGCREVCGISGITPCRFELPCCVCGIQGFAAVQCAHENCDASFHSTCAIMAGFGMNITDQINIQRKNNDVTFHAFCLRHRLCSYTRSAPTETPLEFRRSAADFGSPLYQSAMLIRRNRDICLYVAQLEEEKSVWAARIAAYLLKELDTNIRALSLLWKCLEKKSKEAGAAHAGKKPTAAGKRRAAVSKGDKPGKKLR
ncbi:hypothetical protein Esti_003950 [Eimeria stiedai]